MALYPILLVYALQLLTDTILQGRCVWLWRVKPILRPRLPLRHPKVLTRTLPTLQLTELRGVIDIIPILFHKFNLADFRVLHTIGVVGARGPKADRHGEAIRLPKGVIGIKVYTLKISLDY